MKRLFVGNLPSDATEASVQALFSEYGKVRSIQALLPTIFKRQMHEVSALSGMEGHEALSCHSRAFDGHFYCGKPLKVKFEAPLLVKMTDPINN